MTNLAICPACDGEGSLMFQMAKKRCLELGGRRQLTTTDRGEPYYTDSEGREIVFKTIGGYCSVCLGTGKVPFSQ